jgi:hypothetical protein
MELNLIFKFSITLCGGFGGLFPEFAGSNPAKTVGFF